MRRSRGSHMSRSGHHEIRVRLPPDGSLALSDAPPWRDFRYAEASSNARNSELDYRACEGRL